MKRIKKLLTILTTGYYRSMFLKHLVAAGVEHERNISRFDIKFIIDIGANRGQFALVARKCFINSPIISFEPLPSPVKTFRKLFAKDSNVVLIEAAIGHKSGKTEIHVSKRDDSSSLLPITKLQDDIFPGTAEVSTQSIRVGPLDEFISPEDIDSPALLKLDVQGYELEALKGCESLLHKFEYVYVECSFMELYEGQAMASDVIAWLHERGFDLNGVYNMSYDRKGKAIQADFMFVRNGNRAL